MNTFQATPDDDAFLRGSVPYGIADSTLGRVLVARDARGVCAIFNGGHHLS